MSWYFGNWQDFLKKKACRYILQHYLGQFLKEKLSLDQLSLDLYNGTGKITELNLDVQAINEDLATLHAPIELVDGFVECISVAIPWAALVSDSTKLEVSGLELTLRPAARDEAGYYEAGEMFNSISSMSSSMTTSLQLAKDCLESERGDSIQAEQIEGVQKFANMIDSVLSKVRVTFLDTVIRLEHHPEGSPKGVALELRIKRIEYFDEMATTADGSSVDTWEPVAISQKNLYIEGVQILFDEINTKRTTVTRERSESEASSQMYASVSSTIRSGIYDSMEESSLHSMASPSQESTLSVQSDPVQVAVLTGRQELRLKIKMSDNVPGPKFEISCQFGALHMLLSPRQLHGLLELFSGISTPGHDGGSSKSKSRNKPMDSMDFQRVEVDLQRQLQSDRLGNIQSNRLTLQDYPLSPIGGEDDHFFSVMSPGRGGSDMESSISSNLSAVSSRTTSTTHTYKTQSSGGKLQKDPVTVPKYEDPSAELLSTLQIRVAFFSVTVLHNNPTATPSMADNAQSEAMKDNSSKFFQRVGGTSIAGMTELKEIRKQFAELVSQDNLRLLGKPLNIECSQTSSRRQSKLKVRLTVGLIELVESLYDSRSANQMPEFNEIVVFLKDGTEPKKSAMYSSMHGGKPCVTVDITNLTSNRTSSRPGIIPRTDICVSLVDLLTELDFTIVDRINNIFTPEKIIPPHLPGGISMYATAMPHQIYSLANTMEEDSASQDRKVTVQVTCTSAKLNLRFPIPDLRQDPHVDKSWWQRNLREEVLTLDCDDVRFNTTFNTSQSLEQIEITCSEIHGYFKVNPNEESKHFAHVCSDGTEIGFDRPRLAVKFCKSVKSVLDEDPYSDDSLVGDSLNGACQFGKTEPSPFSSRKYMYGKEDSDQSEDAVMKTISEEMVLPADKDELKEFQEKCLANTKLVVEITLPNVCLFLPDKHFFEVLYNRLNNDLLLWEPIAPSPVTTQEQFAVSQNMDLNVFNQLNMAGDNFEMAKSGIQYDSDSDSDPDAPHYSIHDSRYPRRKRSPVAQQSTLCLSLGINKGRLTAYTQCLDSSGVAMQDKHGEILLQVSDLCLFTISKHNGDPNLQFLNILVNKGDVYHQACVDNSEHPPVIDCQELSAPVPPHLQHSKTVYRSEKGVLVTTKDDIGRGSDSVDMVSVAVRIKLKTEASTCDLTSDEKVKEFTVSVGVRGGTMRYRVATPHHNIFSQLIQFLDVKDYPILGYVDPKVLTELHVHLWNCAIDYRPLHLPVKSLLSVDSFSISSNVVAESASSLLRFVIEDGALYLSKKLNHMITDLAKDYVCVADIGRLEILFRSYEGKDQRYPKTDLRVSSDRVNLRTCADSCIMLIDLIRYLAEDGDLTYPEPQDLHTDTETDISVNTDDSQDDQIEDQSMLPQLSESSMDHVHTMMTEAMIESSPEPSKTPSPETSTTNQTEVFFLPTTSQTQTGPISKTPIVISANVDSVTSSTMSEQTDDNFDDEEDFCMIDDTGWGTADSEPSIRVFLDKPIEIIDDYFSKPIGRADLLKSPDHFPMAESRYTLKELTFVWYMYGGSDFAEETCRSSSKERAHSSPELSRDRMTVSFHKGSPESRWEGQAAGRMPAPPPSPRSTLQTKGGTGRDHTKYMELQLTKVRFQHESYPRSAEQASRQILLIYDVEVRDRLKSSKINKFLYQYSSNEMPKQTYANMVLIKALHRRTNPSAQDEEECLLKASLQPIRLNIDQDTLFFIKEFITDLSPSEENCQTPTPTSCDKSPNTRASASTPPPPVMTVNKPELASSRESTQDLLMQFDELTQDLQASLNVSFGSNQSGSGALNTSGASENSSGAASSSADTPRSKQPVFIKSFIFSPDVLIRLDYHGKFDREHGTLAGLGGLVSLHRAEIKLKRLTYKQGLLGVDKMLKFCLNEWLTDIKVNQLPNILGGFGPMHSIVQLAQGIRDLFWLPVEQYRKDGRIVRGLQRGATSFSTSTAMSVLELTNRAVQSVQWCAEVTFDMVSPGPRRRGFYPRQPADLREGVTNAYIVLREGFSETASNIVEVATKEHEQKGVMGAVGGVIRQIPPTLVQPLIIVPEATSNVLGGLRSQLKPDARKEDEEKWKEEIID